MLAILVTVYVTALIAIGLRLIAKSFAKIWSTDDALIVAAIVSRKAVDELESHELTRISGHCDCAVLSCDHK